MNFNNNNRTPSKQILLSIQTKTNEIKNSKQTSIGATWTRPIAARTGRRRRAGQRRASPALRLHTDPQRRMVRHPGQRRRRRHFTVPAQSVPARNAHRVDRLEPHRRPRRRHSAPGRRRRRFQPRPTLEHRR